jgi:RNA polymerase sigma-70 factor (ECF subfamily)
VRAPDESEWVRQAAHGDAQAFARLVDLYWEKVRRWLFGMTGKNHLAEDVAQDAFLKAWTALPTLRDPGMFRVWLFQIARRSWMDARRRSNAYKKVELPADTQTKQAGPLGEVLGEETREQIQLALAVLPAKYRSAYLLWTQEELPYSEIALILGVSEETARWRVCKARQALVQALTPYVQHS